MSPPINRRNARNSRANSDRSGGMAWFMRARRRFTTRSPEDGNRTSSTSRHDEPQDDGTVARPRVLLARVGATVAAGVCVALVVGVVLSMGGYNSRTKQFKLRSFEVTGVLRTKESALVAASGRPVMTKTAREMG